MTKPLPISGQTFRAVLGATVGLWLSAWGCEPTGIANPFTDSELVIANGGAGSTLGGAVGVGASNNAQGGVVHAGGAAAGGKAPVPCTPDAPGAIPHTVGNYDNLSCNKADCHVGEVGGWVYASANGYPWVSGATITITNQDGSTLTATSAEDGFFDFGHDPQISSPYQVCVSKCPSTDCNVTVHTSTDCLSAGCHAKPDLRIYVTSPHLLGVGGTGNATGDNCTAPAPGGPYVHLEATHSATSNQPCINCHADPDFLGGYLYDGPDGTKTVPEATIVIKPASGAEYRTVTGPDGMFFLGTNATVTTIVPLVVPYTACVSKCPTAEICSITNGHLTTADCGTCHDGSTEGKVYLR